MTSSGEPTPISPSIAESKRNVQEHAIEANDKNETQVAPERLKKVGIMCVSPGLQTKDLGDKTISTLRLSKDIAQEQKDTILKRANNTSQVVQKDSAIEKDNVALLSAKEDNTITISNGASSLKRRKIPSPLNLSSSNIKRAAATSSRPSKLTLAKSAPANVTAHHQQSPAQTKPRVKYLGRKPVASQQYPFAPYNNPMTAMASGFRTCFNSLSSPYPGYQHPYIPTHLPVHPHYIQYHVDQHCVPQGQYPYTAIPFSSCETQYNRGKSTATKPRAANKQKRDKASSSESTVSNNSSKTTQYNGEVDDDENPQLAISDDEEIDNLDSSPVSDSYISSTGQMYGEVQILDNVFAFKFSQNSPNVDKKMFMSICDKVWDETYKSTKNYK